MHFCMTLDHTVEKSYSLIYLIKMMEFHSELSKYLTW